MAMQSGLYVPFVSWQPAGTLGGVQNSSYGSAAQFTFNAADDAIAMIFQSPGTTVPDQISFWVNGVSVAGTTGDIEATLETVSTSRPTGTPVTNSATGTSTISTTGVKTITGMDGTATVVRGTTYAVVLTAGAGWDRTLTIAYSFGTSQGNLGKPHIATSDAGAAFTYAYATNSGFNFGIADASGVFIKVPGFIGASTVTGYESFSNASTPDERGNRFVLPFKAVCCGVTVGFNQGSVPGANDDYSVRLYSDHTGTPVTEASSTLEGEGPNAGRQWIFFDNEVTLTAGTIYAVTLKSDGSDSVQLAQSTYDATAQIGSNAGLNCYSTTRNNSTGACTDSNVKVYSVFPFFSQLDDGAGGGSASGVRNPLRGPI